MRGRYVALHLGARRARNRHMTEARECVKLYHVWLDTAYLDMARVHVKTARIFNRHAWRAKGST